MTLAATGGTLTAAGGTLTAAGSSAPFSPLDIAWHSVFWADEITGLANNDPVSQWDDSSGNARHATQATSTRRPLYKTAVAAFNNQPGVTFDATDDSLVQAAFTAIGAPREVVVIGNLTLNADTFVDGIVSTNRHLMDWGGGSAGFRLFAGTALQVGSGGDANPHCLMGMVNGASSELRVDGTLAASGNAGTQTLTGLTIGSRYDSTASAAGTIVFVGLIDRALTTDERADLLAWSQSLYGTP